MRSSKAADLPALLDLWAESWSEVYAAIDFNGRRAWLTGHVAKWMEEGGLCRIAEADGAMAGFILLNTDSGHLDQICVAVSSKGKGVAEALLAEARRLSPSGLHLDVNAMNARAIRFYEREGFVRTGDGINPNSGLPVFHYAWRAA